jgi:hypothetical protein
MAAITAALVVTVTAAVPPIAVAEEGTVHTGVSALAFAGPPEFRVQLSITVPL